MKLQYFPKMSSGMIIFDDPNEYWWFDSVIDALVHAPIVFSLNGLATLRPPLLDSEFIDGLRKAYDHRDCQVNL